MGGAYVQVPEGAAGTVFSGEMEADGTDFQALKIRTY
jgi:hypothetical protein